MTDRTVTVTLEASLVDRLEALAQTSGRSVQDCLEEAVTEFVAVQEDFAATVSRLDAETEDQRPFLRVVAG